MLLVRFQRLLNNQGDCVMTTINKSEASSYQLIGQDPMTEKDRAAFLQAARDQEKAYDNFVAHSSSNAKASADYPREHLPDMDDPQHRFKDPNHPVNIRSTINGLESSVGNFDARIQQLLKSPPENPRILTNLQNAHNDELTTLEASRASFATQSAAKQSSVVPDTLASVPHTALDKPLVSGGHDFDDYLARIHQEEDFANRSRAGEAQVAREKEEWLANRSVTQTNSVESASAKPWSNPADVAKPLFIEDRTGPTDIAWHKKVALNPYRQPIQSEEIDRIVAANTSGSKHSGDTGNNKKVAAAIGLMVAAETAYATPGSVTVKLESVGQVLKDQVVDAIPGVASVKAFQNGNPAEGIALAADNGIVTGELYRYAQRYYDSAMDRPTYVQPGMVESLSIAAVAAIKEAAIKSNEVINQLQEQVGLPTKRTTDAAHAADKQAFIQAADAIVAGNVDYKVPENSPVVVKATAENMADLYKFLSKDGNMSKDDMRALNMAKETLSQGFDTPRYGPLQGVIAKYEANHLAAAEHAVSMQRYPLNAGDYA
jgi:hypothetical protein